MIISLSDIKTYLNIDSDDTSKDSFITSLIGEVQARIESYTGFKIEQSSRTRYFEGNGTSLQRIDDKNVTAITSLKYKSNPLGSWITIDTENYALYKTANLHYIFTDFAFADPQYELVYTAGYSSIPEDIKNIALEMTAVKFKESDNNTGNARLGLASVSESIAGTNSTTQFIDLWTTRFKILLDPYKIFVV